MKVVNQTKVNFIIFCASQYLLQALVHQQRSQLWSKISYKGVKNYPVLMVSLHVSIMHRI